MNTMAFHAPDFSLVDQKKILAENGHYIKSRNFVQYIVDLYKIFDFFTEVYRYKNSNEIVKFEYVSFFEDPLIAYQPLETYIFQKFLDVQLYFLNQTIIDDHSYLHPIEYYSRIYWTDSILQKDFQSIPFSKLLRTCKVLNHQHALQLLKFLISRKLLPKYEREISQNTNIKWNLEIIQKHEKVLNLKLLFHNISVDKNLKTLEYFVNKLNYVNLSYFDITFQISTTIVKKYHHLINAIDFLKSPDISLSVRLENFMLFVSENGLIKGEHYNRETSSIYKTFAKILPNTNVKQLLTKILSSGDLGLLYSFDFPNCISNEERVLLDKILKKRLDGIMIHSYDRNYDIALKYIFIWNEASLLKLNVYKKTYHYPEFQWNKKLVLDYLEKQSRYNGSGEIVLDIKDFLFELEFLDAINSKFEIKEIKPFVNIEWSITLISKFHDKLYWDDLTKNNNIPFSVLITFLPYIQYRENKHLNDVNENQAIFRMGSLNNKFMGKYSISSKKFLDNISKHILIQEQDINEYENDLNFALLSKNVHVIFTYSLILKFIDKWDWQSLSLNTSLSAELLFQFPDKIHMPTICSSKQINAVQIVKHEKHLSFFDLSINQHISFDEPLILKFKNKWYWPGLFNNTAVNWEYISKDLIEFGFSNVLKNHITDLNTLTNLSFLPWNSFSYQIKCGYDQYQFLINNTILDKDRFIENNLYDILAAFLNYEENKSGFRQSYYNTSFRLNSGNSQLKPHIEDFLKSKLLANKTDLFPTEYSREYFEKIGDLLNWYGYSDMAPQYKYLYCPCRIAKNPDSELTLQLIIKYTSKWNSGKVQIPYSTASEDENGEWDYYLSKNKYITYDIVAFLLDKSISKWNFNVVDLLIKNEHFKWSYDIIDQCKKHIKPEQFLNILSKLEKDDLLYRKLSDIVLNK